MQQHVHRTRNTSSAFAILNLVNYHLEDELTKLRSAVVARDAELPSDLGMFSMFGRTGAPTRGPANFCNIAYYEIFSKCRTI